MKLPKELLNKNKKITLAQSNYFILKRKLISLFKGELKRITKNDGRKIIFKKAGDRSIFSDLIDDEVIKNEMGLYNAKTHWDESNIEFYINENDNNEYFMHLEKYPADFIQLQLIVEYIARHEYGHTFLTENIYNQKPKGEREILHRIGFRGFKNVPKDMQKKIFEEIKETSFYLCLQELVNVDLGVILKEFKEFHANYSVLEKIDGKVPKAVLRWNYNHLANIIKNLHSNKERILENIKNRENYRMFRRNEFSYLLFDILGITYEIYVFSEWDQLIPLFKGQNMLNFLYFMHMINEIFKNIAVNNKDFDSMIENICDLGHLIETVNFEQLIYTNYLSDKIKEKLKLFIT
ncbi:hypothetical protein LCGC14_0697920 [marine sediment metagenome]|uniref:Uncharacterized protein n=1 Tax=marine sediment metagenome TaxID=412755 RepID=A0A0F9TRH4_9ZZZZ|nr:hypothetical protein [bacterium]